MVSSWVPCSVGDGFMLVYFLKNRPYCLVFGANQSKILDLNLTYDWGVGSSSSCCFGGSFRFLSNFFVSWSAFSVVWDFSFTRLARVV